MRLNLHEQETLIPQMKKSEIVEHLAKEGIVSATVYDAIKCIATRVLINDKSMCLDKVRFTGKEKFPTKVLV